MTPESPRDTQVGRLIQSDAASARAAQSWGHSRKSPEVSKYPVAQPLKESHHPAQAAQAKLEICINTEQFSYFLPRDEILGCSI